MSNIFKLTWHFLCGKKKTRVHPTHERSVVTFMVEAISRPVSPNGDEEFRAPVMVSDQPFFEIRSPSALAHRGRRLSFV